MLKVEWNKLGKRFGLKWVFRDLNGVIPSGGHIVIKGSNGSGKSTFGKLLVGATDATEGDVISLHASHTCCDNTYYDNTYNDNAYYDNACYDTACHDNAYYGGYACYDNA